MSRLRAWISFSNLLRQRSLGGTRGQISTFLLLGIVGVLIMALATANLGHLTAQTTTVSNAADASGLILGSQIGTMSHAMWYSLGGHVKKCKKKGILGMILAVVLAVIFAIVCQACLLFVAAYLAGSLLAAAVVIGAVAGAVGGAIGSAIEGTSILQGALMGAAVGAAVGVGGQIIGSAGSSLLSLSSEPGIAGTVGGTLLNTAGMAVFNFGASNLGIAFGAALAVGSIGYNKTVQVQMEVEAFKQISKQINSLPDRDRIRETTFLEGLSRSVDDPNKVPDLADCDDDCVCPPSDPDNPDSPPDPTCTPNPNCRSELIPAFEAFMCERGNILAGEAATLSRYVEEFVNGPLADFNRSLAEFQTLIAPDGELVQLARALDHAGYPLSFWNQQQPTPQELDQVFCDEGPGCDLDALLPRGFDEVDLLRKEVDDGLPLLAQIFAKTPEERFITWENWLPLFYDPDPISVDEETGEVFRAATVEMAFFGDGSDPRFIGVRGWRRQIADIRDRLPACVYDDAARPTRVIGHLPCQDLSGTRTFATIDTDLNDEVAPVLATLDNLISRIEALVKAAKHLQDILTGDVEALPLPGGINPITYAWTDSLGQHRVAMRVSKFKLPRIKVSSSFTKTCQILKDYKDTDGTNTWVRMTRTDPQNVSTGMWVWNPVSEPIRKTTCVSYSYDKVGIARTKNCDQSVPLP